MADGEVRGGRLLPALLGLLVAALVVAAVVQLRDRAEPPAPLRPVDLGVGAAEPDDRATDAVAVARRAVEAFYGLDYRTLGADLAQVRQLATGEFAEQYDATADAVRQRVRRRHLVTTPTLVPDGTATASLTTARAEVLVAVDVVRRAVDEPVERRSYRTRVELVRVDGGWRVSALDTVT